MQEQLKQIISIAIIDKIASNWYEMYGKLTLFKELHHHTNIPESYKNKSLKSWVLTQRKCYKNNSLSPDKVNLLEAIGLEWNPYEASWNCYYEELKVFKVSNNHCNVPLEYQQNECLGRWVATQRNRYKNGKLSANQIKLLNAIGFEWNPLDAKWDFHYEALKIFKIKNNHCNVSSRDQQNKHLGTWVATQRQCYKKGTLSENKIKLLEAMGFEWNPLDANWDFYYEVLKVFKLKNSHCNVPAAYQQDKRLGKWVGVQRRCYKNGKLSANKIKLLEVMGFEWQPHEASWDCYYEKLKVFNTSNSHCNVPAAHQQNKCLGQWVAGQRKRYKNGNLSANKIKLLESIGFEWNLLDANWKFHYESLKLFKKIHKHCNVTESYKDKSLVNWVIKQRQFYKNSKLSKDKINQLNIIGFEWNPLDANWHFYYGTLKRLKEIHNHCNISRSYKDKSLVMWVYNQRQLYRQRKLSGDKIMLLNDIGFAWSLLNTKWHFYYDILKEFQKNNNHCDVRQYQNRSLVNWIQVQRKRYKIGKLSETRIQLLEAIGFIWKLK